MIRVRFVDRLDPRPWGDAPLGPGDAWTIGVRHGGRPIRPGWKRLARGLGIDGRPACALAAVTDSPRPGCGFAGAVGLGSPADLTEARAEEIGRRVGTAACRPGVRRVFVEADLFPATAAHLAAGLILRAMPQLSLKTRDDDETAPPEEAVILCTNAAAAKTAWSRLAPEVEAVLWARRLIAEPANRLTPEAMQAEAASLTSLGVKVTVLDAADLEAQGLGLLLAVGRASVHPPRLIVAEWPGAHPAEAPLALIGKGITFDTGGISIKPAEHMEEMKGDMAGAAAALAALAVAAKTASPRRVVALLAVAENAVGGNATRPGDVARACDGSTVEIVDTDAEGRLALADAIAYARKTFAPALIVDAATLTGAVRRSLGTHLAGLFANRDDAAARLAAAAAESGEGLWRLPLPGEGEDALKSDLADLRNCAWGVVPDALHAALFLSAFAGETPWAHLDIAGTSEADADTPLERKGPRGFGVRLFAALIRDLEKTPWTSSLAD
jgi:leucyl aminopeptidase